VGPRCQHDAGRHGPDHPTHQRPLKPLTFDSTREKPDSSAHCVR
jgi:hypothetical protein